MLKRLDINQEESELRYLEKLCFLKVFSFYKLILQINLITKIKIQSI